ncbi:periplasmic binding protein-like I [Phlyctochytrium arcticum]|nr:periplasmic binding protein-like I [Phlyctochytrium arcticum]
MMGRLRSSKPSLVARWTLFTIGALACFLDRNVVLAAQAPPGDSIAQNVSVPLTSFDKASNYFVLGGLFSMTSAGTYSEKGIHRAEAMRCAVKNFNASPDILPGLTVYYHIADDLDLPSHSVYKTMNFIDDGIMAVIGAGASSITDVDSKVLSSFNIPLVSYASSTTSLANIVQYPNLLRTVADDSYQTKAMIALAEQFDWTLIAAIGTDDTYGAAGLASFLMEAKAANIKIPCSETVTGGQMAAVTGFSTCLAGSQVKVVMIFANEANAASIITALKMASAVSADMVFIASDSWSTTLPPTILRNNGVDPSILTGTISTIQWPGDLTPIKDCFANINPLAYPQLTTYWENKFKCSTDPSFTGSVCPMGYNPNRIACRCNGQETLAGVTPNNKAALVYDAVHTILNALDYLLNKCNQLPDSFQNICASATLTAENILDAARLLKFDGLSGEISFSGVNRRVSSYSYIQYNGSAWNMIGDWTTRGNSSVAHLNRAALTWRPGNTEPPVSVLIPDYVKSSDAVVIAVKAIAAAGLVIDLFLAIYIARNTRHEVIKRSSPLFCLLMLLGMALIYVDLFLWDGPQSTTTCVSKIWVPLVGFATVMGPLLAKTFRIYQIFNSKRLRSRTLRNSHLIGMFAFVLSGQLALLVIWTAFDPISPANVISTSSNFYGVISCQGKEPVFQNAMFVAFIAYNCLLLGAGSALSYKTRNVHSSFNESKYIAYTIYNISLCVAVLLPIYLTIGDNPGSTLRTYLVRSLATIFGNTAAMLILFGTKVYQVYRDARADEYDSSGGAGGPSSGRKGSSGNIMGGRRGSGNLMAGQVYVGGPGGPRRVNSAIEGGSRRPSMDVEKKGKEQAAPTPKVMKAVKTTISEGDEGLP